MQQAFFFEGGVLSRPGQTNSWGRGVSRQARRECREDTPVTSNSPAARAAGLHNPDAAAQATVLPAPTAVQQLRQPAPNVHRLSGRTQSPARQSPPQARLLIVHPLPSVALGHARPKRFAPQDAQQAEQQDKNATCRGTAGTARKKQLRHVSRGRDCHLQTDRLGSHTHTHWGALASYYACRPSTNCRRLDRCLPATCCCCSSRPAPRPNPTRPLAPTCDSDGRSRGRRPGVPAAFPARAL